MNTEEMIRLVRELSGEVDVEILQIVPAQVSYLDKVFHPIRVIRRGGRYLVEVVEFPGEWWMGEKTEGEKLVVWGSYGSLREAAGQH